MTLKPLEILKKGLKILQNQVKDKKEKLQAQLGVNFNTRWEMAGSQGQSGGQAVGCCYSV